MPTITRMALSLAAMLITGVAFGQEDAIKAKLDTAKAAFDTDCQKARQVVIDRFGEVLKVLADKGKVDECIEVRSWTKAFEADGIMCGMPEMKTTFLNYGRSLHAARQTLAEVYETSIKEYTKSLKIDEAKELKTALRELSPQSKLVSLQLQRRKTLFVQHANYVGVVDAVNTDGNRMNATFELVPGLANEEHVSFRSISVPNFYLAHGNFQIGLQRYKNMDGFYKNATFKKVSGGRNTVLFEAINQPMHYICVKGNELHLLKHDGTAEFTAAASFVIADPQFKFW